MNHTSGQTTTISNNNTRFLFLDCQLSLSAPLTKYDVRSGGGQRPLRGHGGARPAEQVPRRQRADGRHAGLRHREAGREAAHQPGQWIRSCLLTHDTERAVFVCVSMCLFAASYHYFNAILFES